MSFAPCPGCARHLRITETHCPFCGARTASLVATPGTAARITRAATYAFTASMVVAGCSTSDPGGTVAPLYGAPSPDVAVDSGSDAGPDDSGQAVALYGAPAPDASVPDAAPDAPDDSGNAQPLYGLPATDGG
jgi:hypothetical protein